MTRVLRSTKGGELYWDDEPRGIEAVGTPFAVVPVELQGEIGWRLLHLPTGYKLDTFAWSEPQTAVAGIQAWWLRLPEPLKIISFTDKVEVLDQGLSHRALFPLYRTADLLVM